MAEDVAGLVDAAAEGDAAAWNALVERYTNLLWSIARSYGLAAADAADVVQTAWLRLVERLGQLRDPERVGSWLATTVRREALRTIRLRGRQVPTDDDGVLDPGGVGDDLDVRLLNAERDQMLWQALRQLPERCQRLLRVLMADPPPSYEDVSAALDMPIGSIGPTRGRCLERLRALAEHAGISAEAGGS